MSLAARFDQDLRKKLTESDSGYTWQRQYRLPGHNREAVDLAGTPNRKSREARIVLIESELRREDPASNVLKIWERVRQGKFSNGVIFIQGFSKVYCSAKYPTRRIRCKTAKELGKVIERITRGRVRYIPMNIPYFPRAGSNEGNGARREGARRFGTIIKRQLSRHKAWFPDHKA